MKFVILYEDAPDADPDIRKTHMSRHLTFLERHSDVIEAAGPLTDSDQKGRDGLWIVEADTEADVELLIHKDPFWPTGLRKSYTILRWTQVYAAGSRLIHPQ